MATQKLNLKKGIVSRAFIGNREYLLLKKYSKPKKTCYLENFNNHLKLI